MLLETSIPIIIIIIITKLESISCHFLIRNRKKTINNSLLWNSSLVLTYLSQSWNILPQQIVFNSNYLLTLINSNYFLELCLTPIVCRLTCMWTPSCARPVPLRRWSACAWWWCRVMRRWQRGGSSRRRRGRWISLTRPATRWKVGNYLNLIFKDLKELNIHKPRKSIR